MYAGVAGPASYVAMCSARGAGPLPLVTPSKAPRHRPSPDPPSPRSAVRVVDGVWRGTPCRWPAPGHDTPPSARGRGHLHGWWAGWVTVHVRSAVTYAGAARSIGPVETTRWPMVAEPLQRRTIKGAAPGLAERGSGASRQCARGHRPGRPTPCRRFSSSRSRAQHDRSATTPVWLAPRGHGRCAGRVVPGEGRSARVWLEGLVHTRRPCPPSSGPRSVSRRATAAAAGLVHWGTARARGAPSGRRSPSSARARARAESGPPVGLTEQVPAHLRVDLPTRQPPLWLR